MNQTIAQNLAKVPLYIVPNFHTFTQKETKHTNGKAY